MRVCKYLYLATIACDHALHCSFAANRGIAFWSGTIKVKIKATLYSVCVFPEGNNNLWAKEVVFW